MFHVEMIDAFEEFVADVLRVQSYSRVEYFFFTVHWAILKVCIFFCETSVPLRICCFRRRVRCWC